MNESKERKYQSGREVLEKYVPGYSPPELVVVEESTVPTTHESPEEIQNVLLSGLKAKLDGLKIS